MAHQVPGLRTEGSRLGWAAAETSGLDALLTRAAAQYPERTAIRRVRQGRPASDPDTWAADEITFARLDDEATAWAARLRRHAGPGRAVVAVVSPLSTPFVAAFYGTVRGGDIVAPLNPLVRADELHHLLGTTRARVAVVTTEVAAELATLRDRLPHLAAVIDLDAPDEGPLPGRAHAAHDTPGIPDDVACLQFTSGTTGPPKAAMLTHRNLLVNAAQMAEAHQLGPDSVVLNHLPKYHLMHMNSALLTGATQILCTDPDPVAALHAANDHRATHYYSIPARLLRLARDERLTGLDLHTTRVVASGGAALPAAVAETLAGQLGVPVFQGYGLAETSPLTHSDSPVRPRPGSVGPALRDTQCRIVSLDDPARVLPRGEAGEVQVRGPQVMRGYLRDGARVAGPVDHEGWLSTGDVGRIDEDGYLFLVDRIKDVFKCDNYLVAPSEVERALRAHPAVADCAVVDYPHPLSGAVCGALIVLAPGSAPLPATGEGAGSGGDDGTPAQAGEPGGVPAAVLAEVNARLPYYQRIQVAEAVMTVERSANGKIQRSRLRDALIDRRAERARTGGKSVSSADGQVVAITKFTLRKDPAEFEEAFRGHAEFMRGRPGFQRAQMVRSARTPDVYINIGWWQDAPSYLAVLRSEEFRGHLGMFAELAEVEPLMGPVLFSLQPPEQG
ncbi:AMP-binding protein [Streptomyces tremellae]|uniref:Uncharacterized protein n=1 Tax=Streptomyces tremellae TaxID=1124239 RepID=A0ABP7EXU7_9ACTN